MSVNNQYLYLLLFRIQQKKAAREVQALLDTQWNAEYSAAEAAWQIESNQACIEEHQKSPKKSLKLPRPRVVDMRGMESVEGAEGVEDV